MRRSCLLVAPDPTAGASGGNRYNLGLVGALRACGVDMRRVDRRHGPCGARSDELRLVDSLYLGELPRFAPCWLLAHYLPALVEGRERPSEVERTALLAADGFVVPSDFMARALRRLAPEPRPAVVVEPGLELAGVELAGADARSRRAVLVANLVPGKGVLPLFRALGPRRIPLAVVGALDRDPAYAAACRAAAPWVDFLGERPHAETLVTIAASDFLVSSSRMESYGLALAEARALGVPIVALAGGNAGSHVVEAAGGRLAASEEELADECVRLAGDRAELERRRGAARARRPEPRTWADAARDFAAAFAD